MAAGNGVRLEMPLQEIAGLPLSERERERGLYRKRVGVDCTQCGV